jgi:uncharacterized membrane protein
MRTIALVAAAVITVICAVLLFAALAITVLLDIESRLQQRRRQLALRRDIRALEKGHHPW